MLRYEYGVETTIEIETNRIYCGDCLKILRGIPVNSVDLIYLDPPFFSQKSYENFWIKDKASKLKFTDKDWEKLRDSIAPNILREYEAIEERWKGGHKGIYVYIAYMRERINQCWRVLKPTGSIYLHCDWHAGHYLKQMMDEVFGYNNFQNEIVWQYGGWFRKQRKFATKHDTIFYYIKSKEYIFNFLKFEYSDYYKKFVEQGWYPNALPGKKGKHVIVFNRKKFDSAVKGGKINIDDFTDIVDKSAEDVGTPASDVWKIPIINPNAKERLGYPTQKPEALLERIIKASSNEGDVVLDPFCGCGTTIAVAQKLNRKWVGIDISRTACDVMKERLGETDISIIGGESETELRKMEPHEFARIMIVEKLKGTVNPKKTGDLGIDGWIEDMTRSVQVKRWKHNVQRQEIDKFAHAVRRDHKDKGLMIAFDFSSSCYNEVERIKQEDNIDIQLKTVSEIMGVDLYGDGWRR